MKITFIHSPENYYDQNYGTLFIPLWAYYLASYLPDGWDCEIIDCRIDDINQVEEATIFAFSGINQDLNRINESYEIIRRKYPEATCILGGPITWSFEQENKLDLLNHFDHLFILDGEETLPEYLKNYSDPTQTSERIIRSTRISLDKARCIRFDLLNKKAHHYYGAVVEVSRGCPFLCEFCDIRVLPGNNKTNTKNISLIIQEMDEYIKHGINKFQFACDNFIGDVKWAEQCLDSILNWKERSQAECSIFTWLTLNLYKLPNLLTKLRQCGFSTLFIGVESVNHNSLLETAKVQNTSDLQEAVKTIHSYGFIIAPGFIFGFDSDTENVFDETLEFIVNAGVIGGDPSFLTALAGTPLFKRMKESGRLIEREDDKGIERRKIETNILYLQDKDFLANGFLKFVREFTDSKYQLKRFYSHLDLILKGKNYIPENSLGYASLLPYLKLQFKEKPYRKMLFKRMFYMLKPSRSWVALRSLLRVLKLKLVDNCNLMSNYFYWIYAWTNLAIKYETTTSNDFNLHSVDEGYDFSKLIPETTADDFKTKEQLDGVKRTSQVKFTNKALEKLVLKKISN